MANEQAYAEVLPPNTTPSSIDASGKEILIWTSGFQFELRYHANVLMLY